MFQTSDLALDRANCGNDREQSEKHFFARIPYARRQITIQKGPRKLSARLPRVEGCYRQQIKIRYKLCDIDKLRTDLVGSRVKNRYVVFCAQNVARTEISMNAARTTKRRTLA